MFERGERDREALERAQTRRREARAAAIALDEGRAEGRLELAQQQRCCGLAYAERARCRAERAATPHEVQQSQVTQSQAIAPMHGLDRGRSQARLAGAAGR
jgi:hypothetical protein